MGMLQEHLLTHTPDTDYILAHNLHNGSCTVFRKMYLPPKASLDLTLGQDSGQIIAILRHQAALKLYAKCSLIVTAEFILTTEGDEAAETINIHMRSRNRMLTMQDNYADLYDKAYAEINLNMEDFLRKGSGWRLTAVYKTEIEIAKCRPLSGACGQLSVSTLKDAGSIKHDYLNDNQCFFRAVARHFVKKDCLKQIDEFISVHMNTHGTVLPMAVNRIAKFEAANEHLKLKINVLFEEGEDIYPIHVSEKIGCENHVNILLYKVLMDGKVMPHYSYIASLPLLLRRVYNEHAAVTNEGKTDIAKAARSYQKLEVCVNCLAKFSSARVMKKHFASCIRNEPQRIRLPPLDHSIRFKNHVNKFKIPIVGFFDFESVMTPPIAPCSTCPAMDTCYHSTHTEAVQEACTYSLVLINYLGDIVHFSTYSGEDCAAKFLDRLLSLEPSLQEKLQAHEPMNLTPQQQHEFSIATTCHICGIDFGEKDVKHRDHCHLQGDYLGAAHVKCNLEREVVKKIPLFCHNFTGRLKQIFRIEYISNNTLPLPQATIAI
jgi:hypothetical protein